MPDQETEESVLDEAVMLSYTFKDDLVGDVEANVGVKIREILDDQNRIVFHRDAAGWDGVLYDDGDLYSVNVKGHGADDGFQHRKPLTVAELEKKIQNHIDTAVRGNPPGKFVTEAQPP